MRHGGVALPAGLREAERVLGGHAEHVGGEGLQVGHVVRGGVVLRLHGAAPRARRLALPEKEGHGGLVCTRSRTRNSPEGPRGSHPVCVHRTRRQRGTELERTFAAIKPPRGTRGLAHV